MKKLIHTVLKGISITAALFVFQACYGTPGPLPEDYENQMETKADDQQVPEGEDDTAQLPGEVNE